MRRGSVGGGRRVPFWLGHLLSAYGRSDVVPPSPQEPFDVLPPPPSPGSAFSWCGCHSPKGKGVHRDQSPIPCPLWRGHQRRLVRGLRLLLMATGEVMCWSLLAG